MSARPARELLLEPDGLMTSSHFAELGLTRAATDAIFRACPTVVLPGFKRPMVKVRDYLELLDRSTYRGDRVVP